MDYTEKLTRYIANFVDEVVQSGVSDVIISPGSRSTPLALTFTEHPTIKEWVIIDERSAAFFALGLAKKTKRPVAMVCTSGTAAANYYPAIVEAHYSRVPLLVLTADRPHELRHIGAPQTIEQLKMYGDYTKWFHEMAVPEATDNMLHYVRNKASHAVHMAKEGNAGPVHLNFPVREPLTPDFTLEAIWNANAYSKRNDMQEGTKQLSGEQLQSLIEQLGPNKKGLFVCGPQTDQNFADAVTSLASKWGIPVLADPLSQVRAGGHHKDNVIEGYDAFLREPAIRASLQADYIVRFGAMPVSKAYLFYVQENPDTAQYVVEPTQGIRDHSSNQATFLFADPSQLCRQLDAMTENQDGSEEWLQTWRNMNQTAKHYLLEGIEEQITEGEAVRGLAEVIPDRSTLYVGNSMAVRDVDSFFMTSPKSIEILANRGANGIDGMVSSGVGASADGKRVTLLLGDLSLFHDMNGLLAAKHYQLPITILLVNNNGGGIFSFLPQAGENNRHFEALFGTPMDLSFQQVANLYEASYTLAETEEHLKTALYESYQQPGLSIIEVKTDREQNVLWHREKWQLIKEAILKGE